MRSLIAIAFAAGAALMPSIADADEYGFLVRGLGKDGFEVAAMVEEKAGQLKAIKKFACNAVYSYNDPFRRAKVFNCDGMEIYFKGMANKPDLIEVPPAVSEESVSSIK